MVYQGENKHLLKDNIHSSFAGTSGVKQKRRMSG
jgi:hypothetical protein